MHKLPLLGLLQDYPLVPIYIVTRGSPSQKATPLLVCTGSLPLHVLLYPYISFLLPTALVPLIPHRQHCQSPCTVMAATFAKSGDFSKCEESLEVT